MVRRGVALPVALRVLRGLPYDCIAGRHAHAEGAGVAGAVLAERAGPECADGARLTPGRRVSPESGGAQVGASGWVCYDRVCRVVAREVACLGVGDVLAVKGNSAEAIKAGREARGRAVRAIVACGALTVRHPVGSGAV